MRLSIRGGNEDVWDYSKEEFISQCIKISNLSQSENK